MSEWIRANRVYPLQKREIVKERLERLRCERRLFAGEKFNNKGTDGILTNLFVPGGRKSIENKSLHRGSPCQLEN